MTTNVSHIVKPNLDHIDNNHKPLTSLQIEELVAIQEQLKAQMATTIQAFSEPEKLNIPLLQIEFDQYVKLIRTFRKSQIKRIKNQEIGTRNSVLYLNYLSEFRNLALFSNRMVKVLNELVLNPEESGSSSESTS